jgi:uncharacterized protein (TIGR02996 family)
VDDSPFLRAVCEAPLDDGPRLVWADALDERGDPRGEFIRVQCELADMADIRVPEYYPNHAPECDYPLERCRCGVRRFDLDVGPKWEALRRREWELLLRHWRGWTLEWQLGSTCEVALLSGCEFRGTPLVEFRRGLVGSVTLTAAQFFGGPCWRCGDRPRGVAAPGSGWATCPICRGRRGPGRVKGVAAALFAAAPITEVRLSDREPDSIGNGRLAWWYTDPDWRRPGLHQHHWLPVELRPYLTGRISEPVDEPRPGVCGFDYGDLSPETDGVELARADLSVACVAAGRARAKLPALARPVSANFAS